MLYIVMVHFFCQAEGGIRYLGRSRGLGDVYKRQVLARLKADKRLGHIPVIMISALDQMDGIVRCIQMLSLIHI